MPKLLKKLVISITVFLVIFFLNYKTVNAQSPIQCGLLNESCCTGANPCKSGVGLKCDGGKCVPDGTVANPPTRGSANSGANSQSSNAPAEGTWYNSSFKDWFGKVYDPNNPSEIFGERYTAAQVQWVIYGLWGFLINSATGPQNAGVVQCFLNSVTDINTCADQLKSLVDASKTSNYASAPLPNQNTNLWSLVFADRPLSGVSYVKEKVKNFTIVPVANAQVVGFGFNALGPVQDMWRAFRDIAFGIFVIVAIVFAFMIMFRVKLSPQTVITVQSALPKIIFSLILVTFSYALAGFLIDLMYIVIGLISLAADTIFKSANILHLGIGSAPFFNLLTLGQPFGLNLQAGVLGLANIFFVMFFLPFLIFLAMITATITLAFPPSAIIAWILFAIILIAVVIIQIWTVIKTIWALLKAFVNILLLTIFAPLQFAAGTIIPSLGVGQWLKSFVSNLSVFVVTGTLYLFSFFFILEGIVIGLKGVAKEVLQFFLGPLLGPLATKAVPALNPHAYAAWPPLLGTGSDIWTGILFLGVSFVLFTLTPKATEIIQGLLSGRPFAYGTAIGEAFGGVQMAYGATIGTGVEGMRKYGQEKMMVDILTRLDKQMTSGGLQWMPQRVKDFVGTGAKTKPQPFHS